MERDKDGYITEPNKRSEETLYYLECKSKKHPKQGWKAHKLCEDKEHAGILMTHPEFIVNTPHGQHFNWRVVEFKTVTKIVSRKVILKSVNKKEEK